MLQVKTYPAIVPGLTTSSGHGVFGLFADQFIPQGVSVWTLNLYYCDRLVPPPAQCVEPFAAFVRQYGYFDKVKVEWVLFGDDARFMRHVPEHYNSMLKEVTGPNLRVSADGLSMSALRDIQPGEELTYDRSRLDVGYDRPKAKLPEPIEISEFPTIPREHHDIDAPGPRS